MNQGSSDIDRDESRPSAMQSDDVEEFEDEVAGPNLTSLFQQVDYLTRNMDYELSDQVDVYPRCLRELRMIQLSAFIRETPGWEQFLNDATKIAEWRTVRLPPLDNRRFAASGQRLIPSMQDYVFAELSYYAKCIDGSMQMAGADGVWRADNLIEDGLRLALCAHFAVIEAAPLDTQDWNPVAARTVLNLINPSLYPVVPGVTRVDAPSLVATSVESMDALSGLETKTAGATATPSKFQWLPSDFTVSADGRVSVDSYINNLHPVRDAELVPVLSQIFERFVPMFAKVLSEVRDFREHRIKVTGKEIEFTTGPFDSPMARRKDCDYTNDELLDIWCSERKPVHFAVPDFQDVPMCRVTSLFGKTLQVIVKASEIVLTPENPNYIGETWHVDGTPEEHIVATGIFCFATENISESCLSFRKAVDEPSCNDDSANNGMDIVFGFALGDALVQYAGSVVIRENRCVCIPNVMQYRDQPFKLLDPQRPGHRKNLIFYLVDPNVRIVSTSSVSPQQQDHLREQLVSTYPFTEMIPQVLDIVLDYTPTFSLAEAKRHRLALFQERARINDKLTADLVKRKFTGGRSDD